MANKVVGYCPVCKEKLYVKTLSCEHCETDITGKFELSPFDYLTKEQMAFALVFIKEEGNIKAIEKALGISYPTVKKQIDDLKNALVISNDKEVLTRDEVKKRLKNGEITFEEAERILGDL